MSYENYIKNRDAVDELHKKYINLEYKGTIEPNKSYMCHCRCCEDLYVDTGSAILARHKTCWCGSFRLEIFNVE